MKKKIPNNEIQMLRVFKQKINLSFKSDKPNLILFGSKARGDFNSNSDLDLLVLLQKNTLKKKNLISDFATELALKFDIDLSPHTYSKKEFEYLSNLQTPFTQNIKKEGMRI
ncbi:nucleotidyltransferase domain-containing protein [Candidatus Parcubacteria bacterium]|nr:nucleotidyltransferase domain-containing protein [Patescibacteria group bacterium]MBU4482062.1 nucleotidyltransferase domain-containing protein [Patescibacteria group bacterium]MCG2687112.1 nucleotidyltransferase domain-containing protein [Candidatus Parcubacteria bacterium]